MRALAGACLLAAASAAALEVPPAPTAWVTDRAGVLAPGDAARLDDRLRGLEQRTGHQVITVLFPSLEGDSLEDFTIRAAEAWKVGRKGIDDGLVFFAFIQDRRMRLEVGYGLEEKVPDAITSRLLAEQVKPAFGRGDYAGGIDALTTSLERIFAGEPLPPPPRRGGRAVPIGQLLLLVVILLLLQGLGGRGRRGRRSGIWWGGGGGGWGSSGGSSWGGGGFGGFSGGGGSFGGGGSSGSW
ncbi:MAG: TPM domain-containing protein [Thermoanaerobaculaceae bacterium]